VKLNRLVLTSRPLALLLLTVALALAGCAGWIPQGATTGDVKDIMAQENARGCIYVRASATPWAQATMLVVGTWGQDPPPYAECWKGLPAGVP
jgi:hypothetical protein